ncbi:aspartate/glutamate racemase family protein [Arthrobacter sp. Hiyo1]|uniref:aspartate/glutamate racemase family protein n=1 Tax=Arthrobacter sp. Hiyo1 TaxID=1588020 RepID=UPI00209BFF1C|nr:aspartate/glutamate racemase family protein [Arthrobacter sp. Hiyo1]
MTTSNRRILHAHGDLLAGSFGFEVLTRCVPDQPFGVYDDVSFRAAAPKVAALAQDMADGVDALIISCCADPGLTETRAVLDIPVIGAGSAAAAAALAFGGRAGVLGLTHQAPGPIAEASGTECCSSMGPTVPGTPEGFLTPTGIFDALAQAHMLVDAGAEVIVQGSTGLSSIGMTAVLRDRLGVPVIDPVTAAGSVLLSGAGRRPAHAG